MSEVAETWPGVNSRLVTRGGALVDAEGRRVADVAEDEVVVLVAPFDQPKPRVFAPASPALGLARGGSAERPAGLAVVGGGDAARRPTVPSAADEHAETGDVEPADPEPVQVTVPHRALRHDPAVLGLRAPDPHTLVVRLEGVAPYFVSQTSHSSLFAAPRQAVEATGARWTKPDNIVTSGPFTLLEHKTRDQIVLGKNRTGGAPTRSSSSASPCSRSRTAPPTPTSTAPATPT